ncbi:hypothetical protein LLT3_04835 [Lactococcus cremoris subsp. cremoris TIFN3]|uniref:Uncharacterized protein n=1 Tax=Lactococcus cremoris subsp. cremoris TIFN3 TaxID=1234873 RepID=T0VFH6_LACLC|nr:hypothetical protein LLT3_04835 [Lactococcus cremoris subsp. cremoris TIFN3]
MFFDEKGFKKDLKRILNGEVQRMHNNLKETMDKEEREFLS